MTLSELVTQTILEMLDAADGAAEIQRNELASMLGCVPSQISYVITSRFTPEQGYTVESRRGGGGCIRITRISRDNTATIMHIVNGVGQRLDFSTARVLINDLIIREVITSESGRLMTAACADNCYRDCPPEVRDKVRAAVFKQMLIQNADRL